MRACVVVFFYTYLSTLRQVLFFVCLIETDRALNSGDHHLPALALLSIRILAQLFRLRAKEYTDSSTDTTIVTPVPSTCSPKVIVWSYPLRTTAAVSTLTALSAASSFKPKPAPR